MVLNIMPLISTILHLVVMCVASAVVFLQEVARDIGLDCDVIEVSD